MCYFDARNIKIFYIQFMSESPEFDLDKKASKILFPQTSNFKIEVKKKEDANQKETFKTTNTQLSESSLMLLHSSQDLMSKKNPSFLNDDTLSYSFNEESVHSHQMCAQFVRVNPGIWKTNQSQREVSQVLPCSTSFNSSDTSLLELFKTEFDSVTNVSQSYIETSWASNKENIVPLAKVKTFDDDCSISLSVEGLTPYHKIFEENSSYPFVMTLKKQNCSNNDQFNKILEDENLLEVCVISCIKSQKKNSIKKKIQIFWQELLESISSQDKIGVFQNGSNNALDYVVPIQYASKSIKAFVRTISSIFPSNKSPTTFSKQLLDVQEVLQNNVNVNDSTKKKIIILLMHSSDCKIEMTQNQLDCFKLPIFFFVDNLKFVSEIMIHISKKTRGNIVAYHNTKKLKNEIKKLIRGCREEVELNYYINIEAKLQGNATITIYPPFQNETSSNNKLTLEGCLILKNHMHILGMIQMSALQQEKGLMTLKISGHYTKKLKKKKFLSPESLEIMLKNDINLSDRGIQISRKCTQSLEKYLHIYLLTKILENT